MQHEERSEIAQEEQPTEEMPAEESPAAGQEPSEGRVGKILRQSLRWIAGVAFIFAIGVLVVFFVRVRPQADQIRSLQRELDENRTELADLQSRVDRLEPLEAENEELKQELADRELHLSLLSVLVDVTNAQLEVAQDQPGAAKAALEDTDSKLESLLEGLDGQNAEAVSAMRNRLDLVLDGLEDDVFAAQRDLEIMANNLVELEQQMFQ
jgi:hypothetical protein